MSERPKHLRVVDAETGEIQHECPNCQALADEVAGLERENRAWRARYADLKREVETDITADPLYNDAKIVFDYWKAKCRHPRSRFDAQRFRAIRPLLAEHGLALCRKAVDGAAFDPFVSRRRNGTTHRHDAWELIFRDRGKFEDFCNRAPLE